jgi:hypothetical protein
MIFCRKNGEISTAPDWDDAYQQWRVGDQPHQASDAFLSRNQSGKSKPLAVSSINRQATPLFKRRIHFSTRRLSRLQNQTYLC